MERFPLAVFTAITATVAEKTRLYVTWPFIDEYFHLRQCQKYCAHDFVSWDNKITTPPGLYLLGTWYYHVLKALHLADPCGTNALRGLNLLGGVVVLPWALSVLRTGNFWKINIVALPLLYTYYFLFYTDVWSAILVVMAFVAVVARGDFSGALVANVIGFASLWFRQTNIVWLILTGVVLVDRRKRQCAGMVANITGFIGQAVGDWRLLVPYAANAIAFAIFIVVNGGITFGDKENHAVSLHLLQVFYCGAFLAFFTLPLWLSRGTLMAYFRFAVLGRRGGNLLVTFASFAAINFIINNFSVVHPFLLADNRHYTFYIYRKVLSKSWAPFVVVPVYHFSLWVVYYLLSESSAISTLSLHPLSMVAFLGATAVTLIPSPLFEPRYFIVPLVLFRMFSVPHNEHLTRTECHLLEFIWCMFINSCFFIVFFNYEFYWPLQPGVQRIIW